MTTLPMPTSFRCCNLTYPSRKAATATTSQPSLSASSQSRAGFESWHSNFQTARSSDFFRGWQLLQVLHQWDSNRFALDPVTPQGFNVQTTRMSQTAPTCGSNFGATSGSLLRYL